MPLLEAFVDENQLMRYKLTTLPKETAKLPILELPSPSLSFTGAGITQTITPNTRNGQDSSYTFTLFNADVANLSLTGASVGPIRRRRFCNCNGGQRFTTFERVQFRELTVIKKNGRRTQFDREKLAKSILMALKKRPIDPDTIEKLVSKITRELEEIGQSEIQSNIIGKKVMEALKELDKIAYIRFASVYTNFKEIGEFGEYIEELDGKSKK